VIPPIEMTPGGQYVLPHNLEAEQSVIGSLLLDRDAIITISQALQPDDFYAEAHRVIYGVMVDLYERRQPADYVTLADELDRRDLLDRCGGRGYMARLAGAVPTAIHAQYYADIVARLGTLRRLIDAGQRITSIGFDDSKSAEEAIDRAEKTLFDVAQRRNTHGFTSIRDVLTTYLDRLDYIHENRGAVAGVPSGFVDLDKLTGGLQRSDLIILAARPAMGKCVAWDTPLVDPDTGALRTAADLYHAGRAGEPVGVLSLSLDGKLGCAVPSAYVDDGVKPVYRVRTRLGREVKTTLAHPFLTPSGWCSLGELLPGTRIAVPRAIPVFGHDALPEAEVVLLAYLIGDGGLTSGGVRFTQQPGCVTEELRVHARALGATLSLDAQEGKTPTYRLVTPPGQPNPIIHMVKRHGLYNKGSAEKDIPEAIYRLPRAQLALFLNRLFATDGSAWVSGEYARISYCSVSKKLALGVQHLLLRFGVNALVREKRVLYKGTRRVAYELELMSALEIERFVEQIGVIFGREDAMARVVAHVGGRERGGWQRDTLPVEVWDGVATAKTAQGLSWAEVSGRAGKPSSHNWHAHQRSPRRETVALLARILDEPELGAWASSDIYWDEIALIECAGEEQVYDLTVPETHNFVAADICVHNTACALSMCHNSAIKYKSRVAIFSLEMSAEQLVQRLLCMEGGIDQARLRTGYISEDEWGRIIQAAAALAETDIYIDDSSGVSTMEMRSKARRLHSERPLDLVIVDYLQLMQGGATASENRVQEISKISRELKGLARELQVPVVALSQVSRAVDARTSHIPMLSDLRESGCLAGDTPVYLSDSGTYRPIAELAGQRGFRVLALNTDTWRHEPAVVTNAFSTGVKPVYRLTTRLGRTIRATANHKFLTINGWTRLDEMAPGTRVAAPRALIGPSQAAMSDQDVMSDSELALLGHLIGDGCTLPRHTIQYTTHELALAETVAQLATDVFGDRVAPRISKERQWYQVYLVASERLTHGKRNPIAAWLDDMGVFGLRSHEKRVPDRVFAQPQAGIARFLRHLWATDGSIHLGEGENALPRIYYASSSLVLARNVQSLLLRLSISATLTCHSQGNKGRDQYHVGFRGKVDVERFLALIGGLGQAKELHQAAIATYFTERGSLAKRDVIPAAVWQLYVLPAMRSGGLTYQHVQIGLGYASQNRSLYTRNVSRERAARVARVVQCEQLARLAESDVYWDEIVSIEPDGEEEVYDLTVDGLHNFVAADITAHNSIEQDADIVMFIYRDKVYNPDTEKEHIADLIVAKHRNGPTGQISLFFNESQTRFIDLAPGSVSGGGGGGGRSDDLGGGI